MSPVICNAAVEGVDAQLFAVPGNRSPSYLEPVNARPATVVVVDDGNVSTVPAGAVIVLNVFAPVMTTELSAPPWMTRLL